MFREPKYEKPSGPPWIPTLPGEFGVDQRGFLGGEGRRPGNMGLLVASLAVFFLSPRFFISTDDALITHAGCRARSAASSTMILISALQEFQSTRRAGTRELRTQRIHHDSHRIQGLRRNNSCGTVLSRAGLQPCPCKTGEAGVHKNNLAQRELVPTCSTRFTSFL